MSTDDTQVPYPFIDEGGERRHFALLPRPAEFPLGDRRCCSAVFGAEGQPQILPRSEWPRDGVDISTFVEEITNQDSTNFCWDFSATGCNQVAHRIAGYKSVLLSQGYLAGKVAGGQNIGMSLQETSAGLQRWGQCPRSLVGTFDYNPRRFPATADEEAAKFRPICWDVEGRKAIDAVVTGLLVGPWVAEIGTSAFGGGHAVMVTYYYFDSRGQLRIGGPNSWGLKYKTGRYPGYWEYPESQLGDIAMFGAFIFRALRPNPDDPPPQIA